MPNDYQRAGPVFERFLEEARDALDLTTRNQTYTVVEGVFRTFRRRLSVEEGLRFADTLPAVLRALFVEEWDISVPPVAYAERKVLEEEVAGLRRHHNFAPHGSIRAVARALRRFVDEQRFDQVLASLGDEARAFWSVEAD